MNIIARLVVVLVLAGAALFNGRPALAAAITVSPTSGPWGTTVTITGSGFTGNETGISATFDATPLTLTPANPTADAQGAWSATFTVPFSIAGPHTISAHGATTSPVTTAYTVSTAAISLSSTSGPWGSTVSVTGSGFGVNETGIFVQYDGTTVPTSPSLVSADATGSWTVTITVPSSTPGAHTVRAKGGNTQFVSTTYTVSATGLTLSRTSGPVGASVNVSGAGFGAGETGIVVTYDNATVATNIVANAQGTWTATFSVPPSSSGTHSVRASGAITQASAVGVTNFTVGPGLSLGQASGVPGSSVTVTGSGFAATETGITVTYDGATVATGISANAQGGWSTSMTVPPSASGPHAVGASGTTTAASSVSPTSFLVNAGLSLNRSSGVPGSSLTLVGSGFAANETGISATYDSTTVATGIAASAQGAWSATFTVPPSASGSHSISASGATTMAGVISPASFTVTGGISLVKSSGAPAGSVTVNGSGFAVNETGITVTYDGATVATGITANPQGSWSATFTVPPSISGSHAVRASGSITPATSVGQATFTVTGGITLSRTSGTPGSSVTVNGSGFAANETGISVTYDGATVTSGISANGQGTWSATLTVPPSTSGSHSIGASGSVTQSSLAGQASFTVTGGITLGRSSGPPGSSMTVNGAGFGANEAGITVTYDGATVASGIVANAQGGWSATFILPPSTSGAHAVGAFGAVTPATSVGQASLSVGGGIALSRTSGSPGSSVTVNGSGFAANETGITLTYDSVTVASGASANPQGGWSITFTVPPSAAGPHNVGASGATTAASSVSQASFTVTGGIAVNRSSGSPGGSITVSGTGFAPNETGITLTYDGVTVASGISANGQGMWNATITVPSSTSGNHNIGASGTVTQATLVGQANFSVTGGITVSKTSGTSGGALTVNGAGFAANETGISVTYDGTIVASGILANSQGAWSTTFTVPPSAAGSHSIAASGTITQAGMASPASFAVNGGVTLARSSGAPGSSVTVNGSGFATNETGISVTYDGATVATGISANAQGAWNAAFIVPPSVSGNHNIGASGTITQAGLVSPATFTVTGGITLGRAGAHPGSSVTVSGSGFGPNETGITVTFDGVAVTTGISSNAQGGWSTAFTVPSLASGIHTVRAASPYTPASLSPEIAFRIDPGISVSKVSESPGNQVTVTGNGFGANEGGIVVVFDNTATVSHINANALGSWTASVTIPPSVAGSHSIRSYGSVTPVSSVSEVGFTTVPTISADSSSGFVGMKINISGAGFASGSTVRLTYDGADVVGDTITTDAAGGFSRTTTVPKSKAGNHTFRAEDSQRDEARVFFTIESTPPPVPALLSPRNGDRVGLAGGASPTMKWADVADPSGVTYNLEIDTSPDFSSPILEKPGLPRSSYALTRDESLPRDIYYWRVQAVDGASNQGAWSQPYLLKIGLMPLWTLLAIIVVLLGAVLAAVYFLFIRPKAGRGPVAVPAAEEPLVIPGRWRELEPQPLEQPKLRGLPWRRSLPAPKGAKPLAPEEQARIKIVAEFAQSLPLVEPSYNTDWLIEMMEAALGEGVSQQSYEQWLQGQLVVPYQPVWMSHPLYQELRNLLEGQPILQEMDAFLDAVNRCYSDCLSLLQDIYRDTAAEVPDNPLARDGFKFIGGVYSDALGWCRGKSLREPSARDYTIGPSDKGSGREEIWLHGTQATTFAGPLIRALDEKDGEQLRDLHLKLRRAYRSCDKAKQVVGTITQLQVQRGKLLNALGQLGHLAGAS